MSDSTIRLPPRDGEDAESLDLPEEGPGLEDPAPSESLPKGTSVGRYLLLGKLGEGGMGVVYEAFDPELGRKVALKLLMPDRRQVVGSLGRARLLREAQSMALLSHPNVVAVHDVLVDHEQVVMVMELVEGMTLGQWLRVRPRSWREVVGQLRGAGEGLAAAHEKGLIHRDFKPENVLIGKDGRPRVADFGIARPLRAGLSPDAKLGAPPPKEFAGERPVEGTPASPSYLGLTQAGVILGTLPYMAPELMTRGAVDARTDQFSFGVVLYEALLGTRPFGGRTVSERAAQIAQGLPASAPGAPRLPVHLQRVLSRALAANPGARYPSMAALLTELKRDPAVRRRRTLGAVGLGLGCAVVLGGYGLIRQHRVASCGHASEELTGAWDPTVRAAVNRAFAASGLAGAREISEHVRGSLDRFAAEWASMQNESCLATRVRGEQSERVFQLRKACLEDRLNEVRATTHLLLGETKLLRQGPLAVAHLTPVDSCADEAQLTSRVRPPEPGQVPRVNALKAELAKAQVLRLTGQCDGALRQTEPLMAEARTLGYLPLLAAILNLRTLCEYRQNEAKAGLAANWDALKTAAAAGDERELGQAALNFVRYYKNSGQDGLTFSWLSFAQAIAARLGDPELQYTVASLEAGARADLLSDFQGAIESTGRAQAVAYAHPGVIDPMLMVHMRINLANAQAHLGLFQDANEAFRQGISENLRLVGPQDPDLSYGATGLGCLLIAQGRLKEAEETLRDSLRYAANGGETVNDAFTEECLLDAALARFDDVAARSHAARSLDILKRHVGPNFPEVFVSAARLAKAQAEAGEVPEALEHLKELKARAEREGDKRREGYPVTEMALAETLRLAGHPAQALPLIVEATRLLEESRSLGWLPEAQTELARALAAEGRAPEAEHHFRRAVEALERAGGPHHPDLVLPLTGLGQVLFRQGRVAEARAVLERSVKLWAAHPGVHRGRADAKLDLARCLADSAETLERARGLLAEARSDYIAAPGATADDLREVEALEAKLAP